MTAEREIDEVLAFIRGKFGIPEGDSELEFELAGIREALVRLQEKFVVIQAGNV